MKNNLEATHQKIIFEWAEWQKSKYPELDMLMHTANEGKRSPRVGAELKKMGMKKGFPDISLLVPKYYKGLTEHVEYFGLFIELKADKTKRLTKEQEKWLDNLNLYGYRAVRCNGSDEAITVIKEYLGIK